MIHCTIVEKASAICMIEFFCPLAGFSVDIKTACVYDSLLPNPVLDQLVLKYLQLFVPSYTPAEEAYAKKFVPMEICRMRTWLLILCRIFPLPEKPGFPQM